MILFLGKAVDVDFKVKDLKLAEEGFKKIRWAEQYMPVLRLIREEFSESLPLKGIRISASLHVTKETAVLVRTLRAGGAEVLLVPSNPLSTQDDVAAALAQEGVKVFAWRGMSTQDYYWAIAQAINFKPHITMDDGADIVSTLHKLYLNSGGEEVEVVRESLDVNVAEVVNNAIGGTEETTTGVIRIRMMEKEKVLQYPVIAVNDSLTKYLFDNRYGTGQSTLDGIIRATNVLIAGKRVVVAGYGWCGRGIAMRARGLGAHVIITEVDPIKALEATYDGFRVMPMKEAAKIGDVFITATGNKNVIRGEHILLMKDGVILANAGHFNVEIDLEALRTLSKERRLVRTNVEEYVLKNGKRVYLLAEGRLVNLVAAEGHPSEVMDMSFSNQAMAVKFLVEKGVELAPRVYSLPRDIDNYIAKLKLKSLGVGIDELTEEQKEYLATWRLGT